ncbi:MAG: hypothetical protein ACYTEQ_05795 [Planctomycetota bacterium]|jgi:hypothetical protein
MDWIKILQLIVILLPIILKWLETADDAEVAKRTREAAKVMALPTLLAWSTTQDDATVAKVTRLFFKDFKTVAA